MKKLLVILILCLCFASLGCTQQNPQQNQNEKPKNVVSGINEFTFKFLKTQRGNTFFSPLSIEYAFESVVEGAGGKTRLEMLNALCLPQNDTVRRESFRKLENLGNLTVANAVWIQKGYPVKKDYLSAVKGFSDIYSIDFSSPSAAEIINGWVSNKTHGKINSIVSRIDRSTRLAVTNAVYFSGEWRERFEKAGKMTFHTPDGPVNASFMVKLSYYDYSKTRNCTAVEIPYRGNYSMVVVVGSVNYTTFFKTLNSMKKRYVKVYMPEVEMRTKYDLERPMRTLGMVTAFTPSANFSGISSENLYIGKAIHEAYVKIDENGTVAAASTYIGVVATAVPLNYTVFKVDRPFYFFIIDSRDKLILFAGRVVNPTVYKSNS